MPPKTTDIADEELEPVADETANSARRVVAAYATDADDLWDAVTNGERIPRWFLPISGDLLGSLPFTGSLGSVSGSSEPIGSLANIVGRVGS